MLLAQIEGGSAAPGLRWAFTIAGGLFVGVALLRGLSGRPGPKLPHLARAAYGPFHWLVYAALGLAAAANGLALLGRVPHEAAWTSLLALLCLATFHAIFHLWRHTTLRDGALRTIIPRAWHKHL